MAGVAFCPRAAEVLAEAGQPPPLPRLAGSATRLPQQGRLASTLPAALDGAARLPAPGAVWQLALCGRPRRLAAVPLVGVALSPSAAGVLGRSGQSPSVHALVRK